MKKLFYSTLILITVALFNQIPVLAATDVPDGSFENFDDTWQCDLNCVDPVTWYFVSSSSAADGYYYAYIFHEAGIYQDLIIPSGATSLSFYYDNQDDGDEQGSFVVSLLNPDTSAVYTQQTFFEQSDTWINGTLTVPSSLSGQTVRLWLSNSTGFNRIDMLQFTTAADAATNPAYASIALRVLNSQGNLVNNATVFIKQHGVKLSLFNQKTSQIVTSVNSNKKGKTPKFTVMQDLTSGGTVKLCAKKKKVKECATINPAANMLTSYDFTFAGL